MKTNFDLVKDNSIAVELELTRDDFGFKTVKRFKTVKDFIDFLSLPVPTEPLLDEDEARYIRNIVRPFRDKVKSVRKTTKEKYNLEFITIEYRDRSITNDNDELIFMLNFPYFPKNTMYKNMKSNKDYTLEELGITFKN